MDRYTKANAQAAFERLAKALGKPTGNVWNQGPVGRMEARVGAWVLEGQNRKYRVAEITSVSGGESAPLGYGFRSARDFCLTVEFALDALRVAKTEK